MLTTIVMTVSEKLGQECVKHIQKQGFHNVHLKLFPKLENASIMAKNRAIFANHYDIVQWFCETNQSGDLMLCEDDCEFMEQKTRKLVQRHLEELHQNYDWFVYTLGQFAWGPMIETQHDRLYRTTLPGTAHCYILNGRKLRQYLERIPRNKWIGPFMVEGWFCVPMSEKFALYPSVATQNRQIKSLTKIPLLKNIPVKRFIEVSESWAISLPYILVFLILLALYWRIL